MRFLFVVVVVLSTAVSSLAQQATGSLDDITRIKSGSTIYVTDGSAQEVKGSFIKADQANLTMEVGGQSKSIPFAQVQQVSKRGDRLWDGFGYGAILGAVSITLECACGDPLLLTTNALFYGGIGATIDFFIKGRTTVYRTGPKKTVWIYPTFLPHWQGLQVSMTLRQ